MSVFLILGGVGIVLLVLALLVGEILEGMLDVDALMGLDSDVFSTASLAGLLGGFGFAGAIGYSVFNSMPIAVGIGVVSGIVLAYLAGKFTALLRRQAADSVHNTRSLLGEEAQVITAIPRDGYGQIRLTQGKTTLNAKSPLALEAGTRVWVSGVLSATSVQVSPIDPAAGLPTV